MMAQNFSSRILQPSQDLLSSFEKSKISLKISQSCSKLKTGAAAGFGNRLVASLRFGEASVLQLIRRRSASRREASARVLVAARATLRPNCDLKIAARFLRSGARRASRVASSFGRPWTGVFEQRSKPSRRRRSSNAA